MTLLATLDGLLGVATDYIYVHPIKLAAAVVLFVCWALYAQWVDKDTVAVNTYRVMWNIVTLVLGIVITAVLLLVPMFLVGALVFVGGWATLVTVYVVHRNGLVKEEDKVLTPAHISRVLSDLMSGGKSKKPKEVKVRVQLRAANGDRCLPPEEEEAREQYRLTQELLFDLFWNRAQRAELAPGKEASRLTYEIDGVPSERPAMVRAEADAVVAYMKLIAGLNLEERRKPQFGKVRAMIGENQYGIEVRTDGSTAGEKLTLRVIGDEARFKVDELGFTEPQREQVRQIMEAGQGLVLISGPPGSGVTTTIYSFTRSHDAFLKNIQMLEYRRELPIDNVTQLIFEQTEQKTFAGDLQRLFRSDPDIVILPDLREQAAAVIANDAAAKKQLVYVALNANDALSALAKWVEYINDNEKAAKALLAGLNQRLVRKLCPSCKQPYKPDPAMLRKLNMPAETVLYRQPEPEYDKRGEPIICQTCQGSGYVGRTAVFEIIMVDDKLRQVIRSGGKAELASLAAKQGAGGLQKQAIQKVLDGTTSIQEVTRVLRAGSKPAAAKAQRPAGAAAKPKS